MLERLEPSARESTGRVLAAHESERLRIAQELHDEVGQELTAVLLQLARRQARAPGRARPVRRRRPGRGPRDSRGRPQDRDRAPARDARRPGARERARGALRPLRAARGDARSRLGSPTLPQLTREAELVIYRVAQEALTNVARHSGAGAAELTLQPADGRVVLTVRDHGRGMASPSGCPATGIRGMRERAGLVGGRAQDRRSRAGAGDRGAARGADRVARDDRR